jgi:cytidylate kinase
MLGVSSSVVCIARTIGAGGEEVGRIVADSLQLHYLDEEILTSAAQEEGLEPEQLAAVERRREGLARFQFDVVGGGLLEELLRSLIKQSIAGAAAEGGVVIVAHAAAIALDRDERVLRVLVTASSAVRARRLGEQHGLSVDEAAKAVARSDRARTAYLKRFYEIDRELPVHYDLVINTDRLTMTHAAGLISEATKR